MKSRVSAMLNFPIDKMWLGTFHSLSLKILRKNFDKVGLKQNFVIIDTDDQLKLIKKICENENIDTKDISPKFFSNAIDSLKNKGIFYNELKPNKYRKNDEVSDFFFPDITMLYLLYDINSSSFVFEITLSATR